MWKELKLKETNQPNEDNSQPAEKTLGQTTEDAIIKVSCTSVFSVLIFVVPAFYTTVLLTDSLYNTAIRF